MPPPVGRLRSYLLAGVALCLFLQAIFWLQLLGFQPVFLSWPFLLAYSQKAMLELLVREPPGLLTAALWLAGYLLLGVLLWLLLERGRYGRARHWRRVWAGWALAEVLLASLGWGLFAFDFLKLE